MSRNDFPTRLSVSNISHSDFTASEIRSSFSPSRNHAQFLPNSNRCLLATSAACCRVPVKLSVMMKDEGTRGHEPGRCSIIACSQHASANPLTCACPDVEVVKPAFNPG